MRSQGLSPTACEELSPANNHLSHTGSRWGLSFATFIIIAISSLSEYSFPICLLQDCQFQVRAGYIFSILNSQDLTGCLTQSGDIVIVEWKNESTVEGINKWSTLKPHRPERRQEKKPSALVKTVIKVPQFPGFIFLNIKKKPQKSKIKPCQHVLDKNLLWQCVTKCSM